MIFTLILSPPWCILYFWIQMFNKECDVSLSILGRFSMHCATIEGRTRFLDYVVHFDLWVLHKLYLGNKEKRVNNCVSYINR